MHPQQPYQQPPQFQGYPPGQYQPAQPSGGTAFTAALLGVVAAVLSALSLVLSIVQVGIVGPFLISILIAAARLVVFVVCAVLICGAKTHVGRYLLIAASAVFILLGVWGTVQIFLVIGADAITPVYLLTAGGNLVFLLVVLVLAALPATGRYLTAATQRKRAAEQPWQMPR